MLKDVPEQLYEAADLDGMGPVAKFLNVTLPMISPVILFNVITLTIGTLQVFALPLALFQKNKGGPGGVANFYTSYMYDKAFIDGEMGNGAPPWRGCSCWRCWRRRGSCSW